MSAPHPFLAEGPTGRPLVGSGRPVRIALDLLGGDGAPEVVADAAVLVLREQPGVDLILVGPPDVASRLLRARGLSADAVSITPASRVVPMDAEPLRAVRSTPDLTVRVAAELVRDGRADAAVSAGHTGAALAAGLFALGRLPGLTRAALAVVLPSMRRRVVLLDVGAGNGNGLTPDLLAQHALAGAAFAEALGVHEPSVGLLTIGGEPGKGDSLRVAAHELLATLPVRYAGPVEGHDIALGSTDVVVTDGFTGNVVLKGIEGAIAWAATLIGSAYGDDAVAQAVVHQVQVGETAGGVLVGIDGVVVVTHGAASPEGVAASVGMAARVAREGLVDRTAAHLQDLVRRRGQVPERPASVSDQPGGAA